MDTLLSEKMLILFAILVLGNAAGRLSLRGISLGTAGVLFVALVFGHFGFSTPREVTDLGLLLFVYAVGLQAGPRFFRTFRREGIRFAGIGLFMVSVGALAAVGLAGLLGLSAESAAGVFAGAQTCTPALAGAVGAVTNLGLGTGADATVGYGIAYPYAMVGVVLLVQLLPMLTRSDLEREKARWQAEHQDDLPRLQIRKFRITNPDCVDKTLRGLNLHRIGKVNISRIRRGDRVLAAAPDLPLALGDVVLAVGSPEDLEKVRLLLGEETEMAMDVNTDVIAVDIDIASATVAGRGLGDLRVWQQFGVVITRIRRQGMELAPTGAVRIEMGDSLRAVGQRAAVEEFARQMGAGTSRADETNMLPFLIGLLLGVLAGLLPIPLPGGLTFRLSIAGGAFLAGLLIGHFGGIGPLRLHTPSAARNLSRELGLMLFLAGAGTTAGAQLASVLGERGLSLFLAGAAVTTLSAVSGLLLMRRVFRMNIIPTMGALCAGMTNPPGLAAANELTQSDIPALAYASVYPVSLILKIILAQVIVLVLR